MLAPAPLRRIIPAVVLLVALLAGLAAVSLIRPAGASAMTRSAGTATTSTKTAAHRTATGKAKAKQAAIRRKQIRASENLPRVWGAANDQLPWNSDAMTQLSSTAGRRAGVVMWYVAWSLNSTFPTDEANRVASWGSTPEITWEPWDPSAGVNQPAYSLADITAGNFDSYLTSWARATKAYGKPIRIRFAHEMNGNWYPWAQGVNGNGAGSYIAAWRHVVGVFNAIGAANVTWVWSPNVPYPGSTDLAGVFPGDKWVDEVDLDGYNWGTMQGGQWTSFADVFNAGVARLSQLSTRPIGIGEVGCPETGGAKSDWIKGMWNTLASWPRVRTLVWFDFDKEADWRIASSSTSAQAFHDGLSGYLAP